METISYKDENEYKPDLEPVKTICRCCLTTEKRVLNITPFIPFFLDLAGIKVSESDGLPPWLCYECASLLRRALWFKHKLLKANRMLSEYLMRCAPFPIDALDPELGKYATPSLRETNVLVFDNTSKSKLGYQKVLEHEKKPIVSALDEVGIDISIVNKVESEMDETGSVKMEFNTFSDYEDNITLEQFRSNVPKLSNAELNTILDVADNIVKLENEEKIAKKKKRTKKKEEKNKDDKVKVRKKRKSKETTEDTEEPKTTIRKPVELDPTKIRIVMLNPEEQFKQSEQESKAKYPFQCHLCYKGFNFDTKLENHMRKHSPSRGPFTCKLCSMYFPTAYSHSVHAHIHSRRYECCACQRRMTDRASILHHYRTQHEGMVAHFTCHICGKVSTNSKTHRGHMRNHHGGQRPECEQCGKTFVNKDSLEEHRQIHQGIKNYACSVCGKRFRTRTQIKHHQLKHTDVKEYYCVECDVRFKSAHSLRQHLVKSLKHKDKQSLKFPCNRCEKRFDNARALTQHALVQHEGLRAHACPACPAALASRTSLAKHTSHVHGGHRPPPRHVCDACGKTFRGKSVLVNHVRTHTGEKPFACATCGRKFSQRTAMRTHVDLVHLKRRRGKPKPEPAPEVPPAEPSKVEMFTKEEPQIVFDSWHRQTNMQNCEVYFTVSAGP
ncbi:uncharacterized protein [Choristoneura fumiferana]|uniref:uncharacterized protein n=1 Tax=Choristoneura fumiferana TaxID=7141 RepID=UPI003D15B9CF